MPTIIIEHFDRMVTGEVKRLRVETDICDRIDCYVEFMETWMKSLGFDRDVIDNYVIDWAEEIKLNRDNK